MDTTESALAMAKNFHTNFIEQLQGFEDHQPPKTMAIVETEKFPAFLQAWEKLSTELNSLMTVDPNFLTLLRRARANSLSFESSIDLGSPSIGQPSALDIGNFIVTFRKLCSPKADSELSSVLQAAESAYDAMFVNRAVGEGTPPATGMHIMWPVRRLYEELEHEFLSEELFNTTTSWSPTEMAPNFLEFLENYYYFSLPEGDSIGGSMCELITMPEAQATEPGQLLLNPSYKVFPNSVETTSEVTLTTDEVLVEYGVDLTPILQEDERIRRLRESIKLRRGLREGSRSDKAKSSFDKIRSHIQRKAKHRNLDEEEEYFYLFGGDALGSFEQATHKASWDRRFFILGDEYTDEVESVYTSSFEGGLKQVPVYYFPAEIPITKDDIPLGTEPADAEALGGTFGILTFTTSPDGDVGKSFVLYATDPGTGEVSEKPRTAKGVIVPVVYVDAVVEGVAIEVLVGGFSQTILPWSESSGLVVLPLSDIEWIEALEVESAVIDMLAYDDDAFDPETGAGVDLVSFLLTLDELKMTTPMEENPPSSAAAPTTNPMEEKPPSSAAAPTTNPMEEKPPSSAAAPTAAPTATLMEEKPPSSAAAPTVEFFVSFLTGAAIASSLGFW